MDKSRKFDIAIGILFGIMTIILIHLFFSNNIFFMWAFQRHHNILSWYTKRCFQEFQFLFLVYLRVCSGFRNQI